MNRTLLAATQVAISLALIAWVVIPFVIAGTVAWPVGWGYVATLVPGLLAHRAFVNRRNPTLRTARRAMGPGTPAWDLVWNVVFWWSMAAAPILAALDHRNGRASLALWAWAMGAVLLAGGLGLSAAAMAVNPFFEGTVRIQTERAQRVVDTGPYARLRHPGYAGLCLWALATPLLLRCPAAFGVAAFTAAWVTLRTVLEDRLLRLKLPGYEAYAHRVRWRLAPGLW